MFPEWRNIRFSLSILSAAEGTNFLESSTILK